MDTSTNYAAGHQFTQGGASMVQRTWWAAVDIVHELKTCRFSLAVLVVSGLVFFRVAQGTEALRVVGERALAEEATQDIRTLIFFGALCLWATSSWYAARVLLYFDFPIQQRRGQQPMAKLIIRP
jgi:hypothetical protein